MKKILVVDDQYGIRVLLREILQKEGYQLFDAASGKQALQIVDHEQPNLILLDMKIPGMDGIEILKIVKEKHTDIHVIMMTAYAELNLIHQAKSLGALKHFYKPFDINDIRRCVKNIMAS